MINIQDIPQDITEKHCYVILAIDVMFINKISFVITTSWGIHFGMARLVKDMKNKNMVTSIEQLIQAYHCQGFSIRAILGVGNSSTYNK